MWQLRCSSMHKNIKKFLQFFALKSREACIQNHTKVALLYALFGKKPSFNSPKIQEQRPPLLKCMTTQIDKSFSMRIPKIIYILYSINSQALISVIKSSLNCVFILSNRDIIMMLKNCILLCGQLLLNFVVCNYSSTEVEILTIITENLSKYTIDRIPYEAWLKRFDYNMKYLNNEIVFDGLF